MSFDKLLELAGTEIDLVRLRCYLAFLLTLHDLNFGTLNKVLFQDLNFAMNLHQLKNIAQKPTMKGQNKTTKMCNVQFFRIFTLVKII